MKLGPQAQKLALDIWQEQIDNGIGEPDETANAENLTEWLANRTYPQSVLEEAASGDVAALAEVRSEAGIPIFV